MGWFGRAALHIVKHAVNLQAFHAALNAFLRTICVGNVGERCFVPDYLVFQGLEGEGVSFGAFLRDLCSTCPGMLDVLDSYKDEIVRNESELFIWFNSLLTRTRGARFVVTKSGRFGSAQKGVIVGDCIAILASGDKPFILRPVPADYVGQEAYRLIGLCYIDGMAG